MGINGFCIDVTGPTVDFGTANYLHEASGFNQITVPYEGNTTTAGTGYIIEQTGGSSGSVVLTNFTFLEQMLTTIYLEIKTNSYTISTPNCGQIT
ncbi:MAG: hypothetical protein II726_03065, partial [Elusimicrobiaceae bacterium]|nr:hypothetical protein [Elusimicrobiaceae bacterium]